MLFANTAPPDFLQSNGSISSSFELAGIHTDAVEQLQHCHAAAFLNRRTNINIKLKSMNSGSSDSGEYIHMASR